MVAADVGAVPRPIEVGTEMQALRRFFPEVTWDASEPGVIRWRNEKAVGDGDWFLIEEYPMVRSQGRSGVVGGAVRDDDGAVSTPADDVERYLAGLPEPSRSTLGTLRRTILDAAPEVTEGISYRMPTFRYKGKQLVGLSASKEHCSLHLMGYIPPELEDDLADHDTGKGTIRFPRDSPLTDALVRRILEVRMATIDAAI